MGEKYTGRMRTRASILFISDNHTTAEYSANQFEFPTPLPGMIRQISNVIHTIFFVQKPKIMIYIENVFLYFLYNLQKPPDSYIFYRLDFQSVGNISKKR